MIRRKVGEQIRIADHLVMTVEHIGEARVALTFDGPREIHVAREEIYEADHEHRDAEKPYKPGTDEIADQTEEIRKQWSKSDEVRRRGADYREDGRWMPPDVPGNSDA